VVGAGFTEEDAAGALSEHPVFVAAMPGSEGVLAATAGKVWRQPTEQMQPREQMQPTERIQLVLDATASLDDFVLALAAAQAIWAPAEAAVRQTAHAGLLATRRIAATTAHQDRKPTCNRENQYA
jgi:hypothetical protein